ncbi:MAG TPA: hypothetical protein P5560_09180 [Thermotogota bacterium]|nr:hypothetical protein [Thermotogota bacterium]HRW93104.1 hypothetical protein [Thermotogota bacterium]
MTEMAIRQKLEKRGEELIERLREHGIAASLGKFFAYHVQLEIAEAGRVNVYYSPRRDQFRLVFQEMRDGQAKQRVRQILEEGPLQSAPVLPLTREEPSAEYEAYVDGSYANRKIGYGVVILKKGRVVEKLHGRVQDPVFSKHHQVGGELVAVLETLDWCQRNGVRAVKVFYDYEGIQKWPEGLWQAKKSATRTYTKRVRDCGIRISWQKVPAHAGVRWNEEADRLARLATG